MSADQQQLQAGGLVPANAKLGKDDAVDTVVARAYRHGVLPGRVVIRLTAQNVTAGDDLEMATLGFGAGEDRGAVAKERKRPLGFPGWALVHDPKNARYALDVVKEFKKHARKAKSKPGHAKEGIDAIADRLGKTVPHFLPSFFEEAGRVFIENGAQAYAAAMFGKAREAEAVHALEVDEQHRVDGFLEFALAGAVTTKALTQYAKELGEHHEPKVAYAHFRQLCLQRTLGGMPPWSGMAKELRRLAKAAKLDVDAEDRGFVAEIIESPALAKAAGEFWNAYREPLTELGKQNAAARGVLLNLFPTGSSSSKELDEAWLDLLDATGATDALVGTAGAAEAQPSGGRAAWFDKLGQHLARDYRNAMVGVRAFALLRRMAPMLVADGAPITCAGRFGQVDADLCELALELGVPVTAPAPHPHVDLSTWTKRAHEPGFGCDPVRMAAHPVLGPLLSAAVPRLVGTDPFDALSRGKAGFLAAKRAWLEELVGRGEQGGLVGLGEVIEIVRNKVKAETFSDLPDLYARFVALDPAAALARSLRVGLFDELGWPAFEEAAHELDPDGQTKLELHGGPPALVLTTKTKAIAIGAAGRLGAHDFVIPAKHELATVRFIGGQFLVVLKEGFKTRGYWSAAPHDAFETETSPYHVTALAVRAAVLGDGAWMEDGKPLRPGDRRVIGLGSIMACDGTTSWVGEYKDGNHRWREVSASGEPGRYGWPSFVEAGIEPEWKIDSSASYLLATPALVGARVRYQGEKLANQTRRDVEMLSGARWTGEDPRPDSLLNLPATDHPRLVLEDSQWRAGVTATLLEPSAKVRGSRVGEKDRLYARGQAMALPPTYWHHFTPRDPAGSRRIHAATDDDARALIAAISREALEKGTLPTSRIDGILPEVTHPRLRTGLMGFAIIAAKQVLDRDALAADRAPGKAITKAAAGPSDAALLEGLDGWQARTWSQDGSAWSQLERVATMFASEDRSDRYDHDLAPSRLDWLDLAVSRSSLAFIALAIGTPPSSRAALAELFGQMARTLPPAEQLRVFDATGTLALPGEGTGMRVRWWQGNAYATKKLGWNSEVFRVLEYAPSGTFRALPGVTQTNEHRGTAGLSADAVPALLAAVASGQTSWSEAAAVRLAAATGLTPSEATFVWAGAPNANDRSANFLPKELREQLGLKAAQAAIARDAFNAIAPAKRIAAIEHAARAGIAALLDGSAVEPLAAAWTRFVGKKIAIPEGLIADADREIHAPIPPSAALAMIGAGSEAPELASDGQCGLDTVGNVVRVGKSEPLIGQSKLAEASVVFTDKVLHTLAVYLPFLYAELPVGDPLRTQAAVAHALGLARLESPGLWLDAGVMYLDEAAKATIDRVIESLGGEPLVGLFEGTTGRRLPGGAVLRQGTRVLLRLHPAQLDAKAAAVIGKVATMMNQWGFSVWKSLEYVRSPGLSQMMARIGDTPVPTGGWEQNPLASAPKVVAKAGKALGVSEPAAALYLQYLTLLWPTAKNLQQWNGWKPKQLEAAIEELLAKELILEAKRERAQRTYFLPGGWEALKSPHPPFETWKLALYGMRNANGDPVAPLGRFLALAPFHEMFAAAWQRIEDGDVPRYDEVKR